METKEEFEKIINDYGKEVYRNTTLNTPFDKLEFHEVKDENAVSDYERNYQSALHTNLGSLTVLNRRTGFGWRDTETGYRDEEGRFWLASGDYDVRLSGSETLGEAIQWVKNRANNCRGE